MKMLMGKTLLFCLLLGGLTNAAQADIQIMRVKALYKSRKGKVAVINHQGKDMNLPTDRIHNLPKARTGTMVTVTLYPEDIGLILHE